MSQWIGGADGCGTKVRIGEGEVSSMREDYVSLKGPGGSRFKQNNDLRKRSEGEGSVLVWGSHVRLHRHTAYFRQLQACALTLQVQISQEFVFPSLVNADCIFASVKSHCWVFRAAAATSCKTDVNTKRPGGQYALNTDLTSANARAALPSGQAGRGRWKRSFGLAASSYFLSNVLCTLT